MPFRAIFEALGCNVTYTEADGKQFVTAMRGDNQLIIEIGAYDMCVNGNVEALDVPAVIINGRTLVPVRVVSETFGANVEWIGQLKNRCCCNKAGTAQNKSYNRKKGYKGRKRHNSYMHNIFVSCYRKSGGKRIHQSA